MCFRSFFHQEDAPQSSIPSKNTHRGLLHVHTVTLWPEKHATVHDMLTSPACLWSSGYRNNPSAGGLFSPKGRDLICLCLQACRGHCFDPPPIPNGDLQRGKTETRPGIIIIISNRKGRSTSHISAEHPGVNKSQHGRAVCANPTCVSNPGWTPGQEKKPSSDLNVMENQRTLFIFILCVLCFVPVSSFCH